MRYPIVMLLIATALHSVYAQNPRINYQRAPLEIVLDDYAKFTSNRVEIVKGVHAEITLKIATDKVTAEQALKLIETELHQQNIGLFEIKPNRLVATWIDPKKAPKKVIINNSAPSPKILSYRDRLKVRAKLLDERRKKAEAETPKYTKEELREHLNQYQMDLIRAKGKLGAPLPIPLTKEQDDLLVKEGVLPPRIPSPIKSKKQQATELSIKHIATAIEMYEVTFGEYPESLNDLTKDRDNFTAPLGGVPMDSWGSVIRYKKLKHKYELFSAGKDGEDGTEDDIKK